MIAEIKQIFKQLDEDNNVVISMQEFLHRLPQLFPDITFLRVSGQHRGVYAFRIFLFSAMLMLGCRAFQIGST